MDGHASSAEYTSFPRFRALVFLGVRIDAALNHESWGNGGGNQLACGEEPHKAHRKNLWRCWATTRGSPPPTPGASSSSRTMSLILSSWGTCSNISYAITVAALGEKAVDLALKEQPGLILLGIKLPDIVGTEVAARLKADPRTREIPIIAVTDAMQGDRGDILSSALLKSRFDQPGSAVIAMARMASPSQAAAIRMNATASSV